MHFTDQSSPSVAQLLLADDGTHGAIVTSRGKLGPEVCSKEAAYASLRRLNENGEIAKSEMNPILRQISFSSLKEKDADVGPTEFVTAAIVSVE